jgi:hypothetical protein
MNNLLITLNYTYQVVRNLVCMKYDYSKDILIIDGKEYALKPYRKWLMHNHESLVVGHFVKAINIGKDTKFYYDWQTIYFLANEYGFFNDYLATL